ncbi:hypothetical protein [Streptomyces coelicoflavus]|uniref:hypothetical protein n=1 Tax=Streptomyces coelicoflavus TaxID=285562 RepID=UPI000D59782F|nr:hypothetical protein [Streptomyces coelicoflavus]
MFAFLTRRKETTVPETTPAPAEAKSNVLMRFLTQGGATVELRKEAKPGRLVYPYLCLGCDYEFDNYDSIVHARGEANEHAATCRAMPKPTA